MQHSSGCSMKRGPHGRTERVYLAVCGQSDRSAGKYLVDYAVGVR